MPRSLPPSDRPQLHTILTVPASGAAAPPAPLGDPYEAAAPEPLDWRRVQAALLRWKWLILGIIAAGMVAGVAATRLIAPTYRAQATIWIDPRDRQENGPAPFQGARLLDPEAWIDLMRSYAVLDQVARTERLWLRAGRSTPPALTTGMTVTDSFRPGKYRLVAEEGPAVYRLETDDGTELDRVPAGEPIGAAIGLVWTPPPDALAAGRKWPFELVTLRDASAALAEGLQLHIDPQGNLLRLELEGTDRVRLAGLLNGVAERYVTVAGDLKRQKVTQLTGILDAQLATATRELNRAESTYQAFRTRTITLPSDRTAAAPAGDELPPPPVVDHYLTLQTARADVRRDRVAIEAALNASGPAGVSIEALDAVPAVRNSAALTLVLGELNTQEAELRRLRIRYTEDHPEVVAAANQVRALRTRTIPALARSLADDLRARETEAGREVASAGASLRQIPSRSLEDARLRRAVTLAEVLYSTLQQRHEEARLAEASAIPDARILDRAEVPRHPVRDSSMQLLALAFLGSAALGLVAALFLDRVDPRFRYPAQVLRELRLPILGAIPHIHAPARTAPTHGGDEAGTLVEAMRGLRMALLNEVGDAAPLALVVSSPGSGDGKSFVASHLATSFAGAGHRTLLIDGDFRRGHLHQRFGRGRRPGLCDVLQGDAELDAALQPTDFPGLTLLPCGSRAQQAPELLGGAGLRALLATLRDRFEVVICDSPPLTAGVDPYLLAVATGRLLLVLRTGVSHREMMAAKLATLTRMPIQLLGVAMNDVPMDDAYGYYSYHLSGYEAQDERSVATAVAVV